MTALCGKILQGADFFEKTCGACFYDVVYIFFRYGNKALRVVLR